MATLRVRLLFCIFAFLANAAYAQINEPNTVVCDSCALATPNPDGTASDTSTTLGVLSHLSGGIDYPPSGGLNPYGRQIYVCRTGVPLENSKCAVYGKHDYRTDPWTGHKALLSYQFCTHIYSTRNEWLDICESIYGLPPGHNGDSPPPSFGPCYLHEPGHVYFCDGIA